MADEKPDLVEVIPISDVIKEFKLQIEKVQAAKSGLCRLTIERVTFHFTVSNVGVDKVEAGGKGEVFGVKIGGGVESSRSRSDASVIEISMTPERGGLSEVSEGRRLDFADLILHTRKQIEDAAEAEPRLKVERVTISTDFTVEGTNAENLEIVVVGGARKSTEKTAHRVTLTLTGQGDGPC